MSKPAKLNLDITHGEDFVMTMAVANDGVAVDITGWTFTGQIRQSAGMPPVLADFVFTITDAAAGEVQITLADTVTAALPTTTLKFDWWVNYGADIDAPLAAGDVTVYSRITEVPA